MPAVAQETVEFVSRHPALWVSLETAIDEYTGPMGGRRTVRPARKVVFEKGRAHVAPDLVDEMRSHSGYGVRFWEAADIMAPFVGDRSPMVTSGQAHSTTHKAVAAPLANWDTMTAADIKAAIVAGRVRDLAAALLWEAGSRSRGQIVLALTQAMKAARGEGEDDDTLAAADIEPDGFVQTLPANAKGLG